MTKPETIDSVHWRVAIDIREFHLCGGKWQIKSLIWN